MAERLSFNLTSKEETSGDAFEPLPEGWYDVIVDEVKQEASKSKDNAGKPMYVVDYKIEGGDYDGRTKREWSCLWQGALFTQVSLQKAIGRPETVEGGKLEVLAPEELIGQRLRIKIKHKKEKYTPKDSTEEVETTRDNISARAAIEGSAAAKPKAKAGKSGFSL